MPMLLLPFMLMIKDMIFGLVTPEVISTVWNIKHSAQRTKTIGNLTGKIWETKMFQLILNSSWLALVTQSLFMLVTLKEPLKCSMLWLITKTTLQAK